MPTADPVRVIAQVYALLGRPDQQTLPVNDVHGARVDAGMQILKAIAADPQSGHFGSLSTLVAITNNSFLPAHDGRPGIPLIVPFAGANTRAGVPAKPDEIDSFRESPELYTGAVDGVTVAHDQADADGKMSPVSARYSIVNEFLKFTGVSAQIPLIQLTRSMADTGILVEFEPTLVKLIPALVVKPTSEYFRLAALLAADGKQDLVEIAGGAMQSRPVRAVADIIAKQKQN